MKGEFIQRKDAARQSRSRRSADSLVRELPVLGKKHADKAVRAPDESSQNATKLGDSNAKMPRRKEFLTWRLRVFAPLR